MTLQQGEHCERCLRHPKKLRHRDGQRCDQCLAGDGTLQRCDACKLVRYCTRECQKAHWKEHKRYCAANIAIKREGKKMGKDVAERQTAFEKWCRQHAPDIGCAALSALDITSDRKRTETHVMLLYVDVIDLCEYNVAPSRGQPKTRYIHNVRKVRCCTVTEVHEMYDWRFADGHATLERSMASRPGLMRILCVDDGLPVPFDLYTLPTDIPDDLAPNHYDPLWYQHLTAMVDEYRFINKKK